MPTDAGTLSDERNCARRKYSRAGPDERSGRPGKKIMRDVYYDLGFGRALMRRVPIPPHLASSPGKPRRRPPSSHSSTAINHNVYIQWWSMSLNFRKANTKYCIPGMRVRGPDLNINLAIAARYLRAPKS